MEAVDFSLKTYYDNKCNIQSEEEFWKQLEDRIGKGVACIGI